MTSKFRADIITSLVFLLACWGLWQVELYPKPNPEPGTKERAVVVEVDNADLQKMGLLLMGSQSLTVEV